MAESGGHFTPARSRTRMIYMVEHTFSKPEWIAEWTAWYAGNLKVLLRVPGFRSAQRFGALDGSPRFMAMYTVDSTDVFESEAYRNAGGGGANSVRFRAAYASWRRNLLDATAAPFVPDGEALVQLDAPAPGGALSGIDMRWFPVVGLHRTTPFRGLAVTDMETAAAIAPCAGLIVYRASMAPLSA